jgi:hypothetical protein
MRMPVAPPLDSGAIASAFHWCCSSVETPLTRGKDAHATPLHSSAIAPALFHPGRGKAGANARVFARRPNDGTGVGAVNTDPVSRIEVKTFLKSASKGTLRFSGALPHST